MSENAAKSKTTAILTAVGIIVFVGVLWFQLRTGNKPSNNSLPSTTKQGQDKPGAVESEPESTLQQQANEKAISELQAKVSREQQEKEERAKQDICARVNKALKGLQSDVDTLSGDNYTEVIRQLRDNWFTMQSHNELLQEHISNRATLGTIEADLSTLEADIGSFEFSIRSKEAVDYSINCHILNVSSGILSLQKAWSDYQNAGSPGGQFNSQDIQSILNAAQKEIDKAQNAMKGGQEQLNSYQTKAKHLYLLAVTTVDGLR
ncbi:MAG: hypothetical protein ACYC21_09925 [Eubacteriales bacterium]